MECTSHQIPEYLDRNNRQPLGKWWLWYFHKAYRDIDANGNEISFPGGRINNVSCKWSKLIQKQDLDKVQPFSKNYRFSYLNEIFSLQITSVYNENHERNGKHVLSCKIVHTPDPCNFSHIEILINHKIFDLTSGVKVFESTYSRDDWENKTAVLRRYDNKFFKQLRKDFRIKLTTIFNKSPEQNIFKTDIKAFLFKFN
jgi:hypothetical protein